MWWLVKAAAGLVARKQRSVARSVEDIIICDLSRRRELGGGGTSSSKCPTMIVIIYDHVALDCMLGQRAHGIGGQDMPCW
jgi:hypothetical protein